MEIAARWVATYPGLILFAIPAMAAGLVWWAGHLCDGRVCGRRLRTWGWCVAVGATVFFLLMAVLIAQNGALVRFDHELAAALGLSMSPSLLWLLSWFTHLGDRNLLTVIAIAMTGFLLWRRAWRLALACVIVTGGGGLLNMLMKHSFQRVRPEHVHGYVQESGWSFPSGHASASMAVYGFACYVAIWLLPARWHRFCLVGGAILISAIGVSRVLLQVHYLSDVMAGFALSLAWLSLCLAAMSPWLHYQAK